MVQKAVKQYQVALDAGGTMTDTFLIDEQGEFTLGKYLTNPQDESVSYMGSVRDACETIKVSPNEMFEAAISNVYAGTLMLNLLITGGGRKVGLLVSPGQHDTPFLERAFTWLGREPYDKWKCHLHQHTRPMVEMRNVKPVMERVSAGNYFPPGSHYEAGKIVIPLHEADVTKAVEELLDTGVEVIGICFLNSFTNPTNEHRAAEIAREIIKKRGVDVGVICSADVCPRQKESTRMKSLLVECFATDKCRAGLLKVESAAKGDGYRYNLQTLLGYGAVVDVRYPRLFECVVSGPVGGLLGAKALGEVIGLKDFVCADLGGTSLDVGMIIDGQVAITTEPNFARHRLNMAMLSLDSVGAGTGTVIHVDPVVKRVTLGPESAGYRVGVCLDYPEITISDADVTLGLLSPDYFLGGKVKLDKKAAIRALEERLAKPLDMDVYEAAEGVLDLQHSALQDHINNTLLARGFDPLKYTLLVYGGSGPLHLWGLERRLKLAGQATVPWAAAFSAYGITAADYFHHYEKSVSCPLLPGLPPDVKLSVAEPMNQAWQELERLAYDELEREGFSKDQITFRYGIAARYVGQLFSSWLAPVDKARVETVEDLEAVCNAFERTYLRTYPTASRFPEAGYLITSVFLDSVVPKVKPKIVKYPLKDKKPSKAALKGQRQVYWDKKWEQANIWEMDLLEPGNHVDGPAIIEHPMTTLPIPPGKYVTFDEYKVIWYRSY